MTSLADICNTSLTAVVTACNTTDYELDQIRAAIMVAVRLPCTEIHDYMLTRYPSEIYFLVP